MDRVVMDTEGRVSEAVGQRLGVFLLESLEFLPRYEDPAQVPDELVKMISCDPKADPSGKGYFLVFSRRVFRRSSGVLFVRISLNWVR